MSPWAELRFTLSKSRMKAIFLWHSDARANYEGILQEATHGQSLELKHTIYFDSSRWEELLHAPGEIPSAARGGFDASLRHFGEVHESAPEETKNEL